MFSEYLLSDWGERGSGSGGGGSGGSDGSGCGILFGIFLFLMAIRGCTG